MPKYLSSILIALVLPSLWLWARNRARLEGGILALSIGTVALLGWSWSFLLNYNGWWTFAPEALLGPGFGPHLPLEEILFYPSGGALSILLYQHFWRDEGNRRSGPLVWHTYVWVGTALFVGIAWHQREIGPWYLCSQLVLYDFGIVLPLSVLVARRADTRAIFKATGVMSALGYAWDHIGFYGEWWSYPASTGLWIGRVPVDDFNFFAFAPAAAVSLYFAFSAVAARAGLEAAAARS